MDSKDNAYRKREYQLRKLLRETGSVPDYRRLLALLMKTVAKMSATEIACLLMLRPKTVENLVAKYKNKGLKTIVSGNKRGGRRRCNLSTERELNLIHKSCVIDKVYGKPTISMKTLRSNYSKWVKAGPADSTIYRLLKRHVCTKVAKGLYAPPSHHG